MMVKKTVKKKKLYMILGMHRSGTSALARVVSDSGVGFGSDLIEANFDNPLGFFEDKNLVEINERILHAKKNSWDFPVDCAFLSGEFPDVEKFVESKLHFEKLGLKDPRLCLTFPVWLESFERYFQIAIIYCVRHPLAVAKSLSKRNDLSISHGLYLWLFYNFNASKYREGRDNILVQYEHLIEPKNFDEASFRKFLDLSELNLSNILSDLSHQDSTEKNVELDDKLYPICLEFYYALLGNSIDDHIIFKVNAALADTGPLLNGYYDKIQDYSKSMAECAGFVAHQENDIEKLNAEIRRLRDEVDKRLELDAVIKQQHDFIERQRNDIEAFNAEIPRLRGEIDRRLGLDFVIKEKNSCIELQSNEIRKFTAEIRELKSELEARRGLDNVISEQKNFIGNQNQNIMELQQEILKLKSLLPENEELRKTVQEQKSFMDRLKKDIQVRNFDMAMLESKVSAYEMSISDIQQSVFDKCNVVANQIVEVSKYKLIDGAISAAAGRVLSCLEKRTTKNPEQLVEFNSTIILTLAEVSSYFIRQLNLMVELNEELEKRKETYDAMLNSAIAEVQGKNEEIEIINHELWRVKQINIAIESSLSWKIMSPFRAIFGFMRNTKRSCIGRVVFALYQFKSRLISLADRSKGNSESLNNIIKLRQGELLSEYHIKKCAYRENFDGFSFEAFDLSLVTYNNGEWLPRFFDSLISQNFPLKKINVVIVDNGSSDNTLEIIKSIAQEKGDLFGSFLSFSQENVGFGAGHDLAIKKGKSRFVLVCNIDVELNSDTIEHLMFNAQVDLPQVACWEARQLPYEHPKFYDPVTNLVNWCSHCCILIRREAYESVGGYEKKIFMYGEDVELSYRFTSNGWLLRYVPCATLWHYTYKYKNEFKPVQFLGSTFANGLIRFRYGSWRDVIVGIGLQFMLILSPIHHQGFRHKLSLNFLKLLLSLPLERFRFVKKRGTFPFRGFDYDMCRNGAFYPLGENPSTSSPLVTIITRTYAGREKFLRECVTSVFNQTYKNIEHVIVEDGGDSHKDLIYEIQQAYSSRRVLYAPLPKHGRSFAGNAGLNLSTGKWCMFLDDDDLLLSDHVEVLVTALQKNNMCSAAYSLAWEVKTDFLKNRYSEKSYETQAVFFQPFDRDVLFHHNYIPIQAILFERLLYENLGGFDETLDQLEDWNLWVKYSLYANFVWVEKTTSIYRTPFSLLLATKRKALLDQAYDSVLKKNEFLIRQKYNPGS